MVAILPTTKLSKLGTQAPVKIAASTLSFLSSCDSCIWREQHLVKHPRGPFPSVFSKIDRLNRDFYDGKSLKTISPDLPDGILQTSELWVQSKVFEFPGHTPFFIVGKLDALGIRADGQGCILPDFKTIDPKTQHLSHYGLQLGGYSLCLENPAPGKPTLGPVTDMGLLTLMPRLMCASPTGKLGYIVEPNWVPLARDDQGLFAFIFERLLRVLELPEQPDPAPDCEWCHFVDVVGAAGI